MATSSRKTASRRSIKGLFSEVTVTPKGMALFKTVLQDNKKRESFLKDQEKAAEFIKALSQTGPRGKALALAALEQEDVFEAMIICNSDFDVLDVFKTASKGQQTRILDQGERISLITQRYDGNIALDMLRNLGNKQRATLLKKTGVIRHLLGHKAHPQGVLNMIKDAGPAERVEILCAEEAIEALGWHGARPENQHVNMAHQTIALIREVPTTREQAVILSRKGALMGLSSCINAVLETIRAMPAEDQIIVFQGESALFYLAEPHGLSQEVSDMVKLMTLEQQVAALRNHNFDSSDPRVQGINKLLNKIAQNPAYQAARQKTARAAKPELAATPAP